MPAAFSIKEVNKMKGLRLTMITMLIILSIVSFVKELFAETRTLSTRVIITVKAPEPQGQPQADAGIREAVNSALSQSIAQRIVKVDSPLMPGNSPTYTVTERF